MDGPALVVPAPYAGVAGVAPETVPQAQGSGSLSDEPKVVILGWSFNSEVSSTVLPQSGEVSLDPGQPEVILFFDTTPVSQSPPEFRYRLDDYDLNLTVTRDQLAPYHRLAPGLY